MAKAKAAKKPKASNGVAPKKRQNPPKQKTLPGMGPGKPDSVIDPLAIGYYDKVLERLALQREEKDLKSRLEFAMDQKKIMYYQASDGTEVEYPPADRKLKVKRETDGDNALDTSDNGDAAPSDEFGGAA